MSLCSFPRLLWEALTQQGLSTAGASPEDASAQRSGPARQDQASLESEKQKISAVVRNLQRELEESAEETGHWRDMFQKNKDELRTTKQE